MKIRVWFCLVLLLSCPLYISAMENNIAGDVRAASLGFSGVGDLFTGGSFYVNPAFFAQSERSLSTATSELYGESVYYNFLETRFRILPSFSAGVGFESIADKDNFLGTGYGKQIYTVCLAAKPTEIFQVGFNLNKERFNIENEESGRGMILDLGLACGPWAVGVNQIAFGAKVNNLLYNRRYNSGLKEEGQVQVQYGMTFRGTSTVTSLDLYKNQLRLGVEYTLAPNIALRAGLMNGKPSFGFGLAKGQFQLNYAYWLANVGATQRIGGSFSF